MGKLDAIKKIFSRELRSELTLTERKVWEALRNRRFKGLKFRRQHVISGFVVDFYCHECDLAIEIDGKSHLHQEEYDVYREGEITKKGITIIRISNSQVMKDINLLFKKIDHYLEHIKSPSPEDV